MERLKLKVLMVSSDRQILSSGSLVGARMRAYGALVEELHIVLLSDQGHRLEASKLAENVWVYPTSSISRFARPIDAFGIGSEVIEKNNFKVGDALITTQDPFECGWTGLRLKKKFGIPLEVQIHTDPFSIYFSGFLNFIRKIIARVVLPKADGVRVVLKSVGLKLEEKFGINSEKIKVLPIYIDRSDSEATPLDLHIKHGWRIVVLSASRLEPEKNLDLLMKAFKDVVAKFPHTGLVIAGAGGEESKLKHLAQSLGIEKNVIFVGWQRNLKPFYEAADIFVQVSRFEGYGLSFVEAGLTGLPTVSTSVGIAKELRNNEQVVTVEQNTKSISQAICRLIEEESLRERLGNSLKNFLQSKILTKEEYMSQLKENWEATART